MSAANTHNKCDQVAALRFLAAAAGQMGDTGINDEEAHGFEVLLKLIADNMEGAAA